MGCSAGLTAIDKDLAARFKAALDRLNPAGGRLGLAVSGGPDSMAMLLLAQEAVPGGFEVATVNHGLRPEAQAECALVAAACQERGVPCEVLKVELSSGNVQARAREARYGALQEWSQERGLATFATAHHADDQAETLLMRLSRGVGVTGLAGIAESLVLGMDEITVIRPLLQFRKSELLSIIASSGQAICEDPSNANRDYERVRMRQAIAGADWLDPLMLARAARHLRDADDALWWASELVWEHHIVEDQGALRFRVIGPREIRLRVVGCAISKFGGDPEGGDVARLLDRLERGENGNLAGVLATVEGKEWVFRREPARRSG